MAATSISAVSLLGVRAALAVARRRRRTVVAAGLVVAASMLLLAAALQLVRGVYLDAISTQQISRATSAAFYDTLVAFIRHNLRAVLVVSLVVAVVAWLLGLVPVRRRAAPGRG